MSRKIKEFVKRVLKVLCMIYESFIVLFKSFFLALLTLSRGDRTKLTEKLNKDVIILGNGPSLNEIDLEKVKEAGIEIACVNFFPSKNEMFWKIKPNYLCLIDPGFYDEDPAESKPLTELFDALEKVDWQLNVICPQKRSIPVKNKNINYLHVNCAVLHSVYLERYLQFMYRHNILAPGMRNVVIGAGYYFLSRRVNNLYYAGIDMSEFKQLFVDRDNRVYVDTIHNYGKERFYSTIIEKGEFYKLLDMYRIMFEEFHFLSRYAKCQGVNVINLSVDSYVDVFDKKELF